MKAAMSYSLWFWAVVAVCLLVVTPRASLASTATSATSPASRAFVVQNDEEESSEGGEEQSSSETIHTETNAPRTSKRWTLETMNPNLKKMEYAVRGQVVIAADQISDELSTPPPEEDDHENHYRLMRKKYPFDHIVYTNIGNPQSVGQRPLTWPRQVLALVDLPDDHGVDHPDVTKLFPLDVIRRARELKQGLGGSGGLSGSTGAYTHSKGAKCIRLDVARFVEQRDGLKADPEDIYLTNGASAGIMLVLSALISAPSSEKKKCGVMIPIPQYPIYSATIDLYGGHRVGYSLDESHNWALSVEELERALEKAQKDDNVEVAALVLINPGNPTGQVLSRENVHAVVQFCAKHKLVLLADEVYQENVYDETAAFLSCKRAAFETGLLNAETGESDLELVSFHSVSKGVFGECGRRGGYMELVGIDPAVKEQIYKASSACLCSTVAGQIMVSCMVRGPLPGDESYETHEHEKRAIWDSLNRKSHILGDGLNKIKGFQCQKPQGAMYCFPSVELPPSIVQAAAQQNTTPDTLYAVSLLQKTGICVVPASGFGQEPGRYGFRTTFLPPEAEMIKVVEKIEQHYQEFLAEYETED